MKNTKSFRIAFLLFMFVSILGCNSGISQSRINYLVDELNKKMPMSIGMVGEITNISIANGYLNMVAYANEDYVNIDALKKSPDLLHDNLVQMYTNSTDSGIGALLEELEDAGLGFRITYIGKKSGKSVSASLSNAEIRKIATTPTSAKNPIEMLNAQIRATNVQLPMDLGNGMIMYKMALEGGYVVYYYRWDDENVKYLEENITVVRNEVLKELKNGDPSIILLKQMCKEAGCGMAYCYVAKNSGKKVWVRIGVNEL